MCANVQCTYTFQGLYVCTMCNTHTLIFGSICVYKMCNTHTHLGVYMCVCTICVIHKHIQGVYMCAQCVINTQTHLGSISVCKCAIQFFWVYMSVYKMCNTQTHLGIYMCAHVSQTNTCGDLWTASALLAPLSLQTITSLAHREWDQTGSGECISNLHLYRQTHLHSWHGSPAKTTTRHSCL